VGGLFSSFTALPPPLRVKTLFFFGFSLSTLFNGPSVILPPIRGAVYLTPLLTVGFSTLHTRTSMPHCAFVVTNFPPSFVRLTLSPKVFDQADLNPL